MSISDYCRMYFVARLRYGGNVWWQCKQTHSHKAGSLLQGIQGQLGLVTLKLERDGTPIK